MPQFLKQYGEQLVALGYTVLPIRPGTKRPDLKNWPNHETTAADVVAWYSNGRAAHGAGINARNAPAIDVDVLDPDVAQQMSDAIDAIFPGERLMTRTGLAPKFLVPFRSDTPFRKMTSHVYTDGKNEHKVEILGDGQQWVAYHVHPDTGSAYEWWDGISDTGITGAARADLPVLARTDAQRVIDAFERIAAGMVAGGKWTARTSVTPESKMVAPETDPFGDAPVGKSESEVAALLKQIPNQDLDYEKGWFPVLCAIHHELGDAGRDLAHEWSATSAKHTDEKFDTTWNSLGRYTGRQTTLRSLLKVAEPQHKPRLVSASEDDPWPQIEWGDFKQGYESIPWIIKGLIPQAELGFLYGASGSGKTFLALDLAATIARGGEWRGLRVMPVPVVYIAAEAGDGIKKRMAAYDKEFGSDGARPRIMTGVPNLLSPDDTEKIIRSTKLRGTAGLIIVDTMAASHTGDENSSKDMGQFITFCKEISAQTGAMVLVVHHTGKDDTKGVRGHSSLFAAADVVLEVFKDAKDEKLRAMRVIKQKDGETGAEFPFRLGVVSVGTDTDGDEITTCVVRESVEAPTKRAKKETQGFEDHPKYAKQRHYLDILASLAGLANDPVLESDLLHAIQADKIVNPEGLEDWPRPDNIRRSFLTMSKQGKISVEGRYIRLLL